MATYRDPGPPAPSDFEIQDDFDHRRRLADKREYREALAEAEHRIERLETALAATIRALRDQIDAEGEDAEAFLSVNKHSHNVTELEAQAEILEHPISEKFNQWLETIQN